MRWSIFASKPSRTLLAVFICLTASQTVRADEPTKPLEPKAIAKLGRPATAYVEAELAGKGLSSGSAFCVHSSGLFVTNSHVVKNPRGDIRIVLNPSTPEQKVLTAKVLRSDDAEDLALLKVNDKTEFATVELGSTDGLGELQKVIAFGFPFGKRLAITDKEFASVTVNALSISSLRNKGKALYRIQLDGTLNPGNSGGPVLDETGRVIGVVVSGIRGSGLAEAIPVSLVRKFLATPTVSISYPSLSLKDQGKPASFEAKVASFMPGGKIELELTVESGSHRVSAPMTLKGDAFTALVIALPAPSTNTLAATVHIDGATIPMKLDERKIQIGSTTVDLGMVSQVDMTGKTVVVLADGTRLTGSISGLGAARTTIAGQELTIPLAKASKIVMTPREAPSSVRCTVVARVDGKEVTREEHTISVAGGATPVRVASGGSPTSPTSPSLSGNKIEIPLPSLTDLFCVGGNGRYIILRLPRERKLAVFDSNEAKIVRYLPLPDDNVLIAAGQEKLFVALPNSNAIQRWDLGTLEKEVTAPLTLKNKTIGHLLMGSASRGPLLIIEQGDHEKVPQFLDAATLKTVEFATAEQGGRFFRMANDSLLRVSSDGTTFTWWGTGSPSGFNVMTVLNDKSNVMHVHTSCGHLAPSPDGKVMYTARGTYTPEGKLLNGPGDKPNEVTYLVPAVHGRYYLRLPTGSFPYRDKPTGSVTLHIEGDVRPLATLKDVETPQDVNPWDREKIGADQRVMLIPSAKLLVTIPTKNDRLVLHKLDVDAAIEASGIDYLLVTSTPISTVRRGATFSYDIAVKSKKGGVKFKLESGPEGMKVDSNGKLTWAVNADFSGKTADVLLTIADSAGQETFHSFKIRVTD